MRRKELARILGLSVAATVLLSGCSTWDSAVNYMRSDSKNVCPDAAILANTAVIPVYDPAKGADPANVVYTVEMKGLSSRCDYNKRESTADVNLHIQYVATRPSGGEEAHYRLPYYLAVTLDGKIVDKTNKWLEFDFPKGAATYSGEVLMDSYVFNLDPKKRSFEYHVLTGFQLTQAQIDYNKKMGQYLP